MLWLTIAEIEVVYPVLVVIRVVRLGCGGRRTSKAASSDLIVGRSSTTTTLCMREVAAEATLLCCTSPLASPVFACFAPCALLNKIYLFVLTYTYF